jgi:hypothetical protein
MKAPFDLRVPRRDLPEPLRPWVQEYYETGLDIPPGETLRIPVSATTNPVMNVTYGGSVVIRIGRPFTIPRVTIAGPQPAAYTVEPAGQLRGFYIPFTPVGLLGCPAHRLGPGAADGRSSDGDRGALQRRGVSVFFKTHGGPGRILG